MLPTGDEGIVYLTVDDVLALHAEIFECSVAQARFRLRAPDALASALARPRQYALYQDADLALQAGVMTHGIAETQPFLDGNKRTAAIALNLFLDINGIDFTMSNEDLAAIIWWFSEGLSPEDFAERARPYMQPRG